MPYAAADPANVSVHSSLSGYRNCSVSALFWVFVCNVAAA